MKDILRSLALRSFGPNHIYKAKTDIYQCKKYPDGTIGNGDTCVEAHEDMHVTIDSIY